MTKNTRPKKMNIHTGIDIGSAKIRCAIIETDIIENTNKLLGLGSSESTGITRGSITSREKFLEEMETDLVEAEKMANVKVEKVWLSVSGEHIRGINTQFKLTLRIEIIKTTAKTILVFWAGSLPLLQSHWRF